MLMPLFPQSLSVVRAFAAASTTTTNHALLGDCLHTTQPIATYRNCNPRTSHHCNCTFYSSKVFRSEPRPRCRATTSHDSPQNGLAVSVAVCLAFLQVVYRVRGLFLCFMEIPALVVQALVLVKSHHHRKVLRPHIMRTARHPSRPRSL
jgi:hypothetical protein